MKTIEIDEPFAVFSDVHGNLPGLEAILADIERRASRGRSPWATWSATAPRPTRSPSSSATPPSQAEGKYDQGIGFELGDCGCVYKTEEQRAEGAASLAWTQEVVSDEVKSYLRTLEDHFLLGLPPATSSPCTAARGASTSTCSRTDRRLPWNAWRGSTLTKRSPSGTPTCPMCARSARRPSSTSAAAGGPRTATGASAGIDAPGGIEAARLTWQLASREVPAISDHGACR